MSSLPANPRPSLPSGPLQKETLKAALRQKVTHDTRSGEKSAEISASVKLASTLFDMACIAYGQKNEALALTITEAMGSTVSASLVGRWRKAHEREVPSDAQILALGSDFNRIYYRMKNKHFGWSRRTLLDLAESLGDVAGLQE